MTDPLQQIRNQYFSGYFLESLDLCHSLKPSLATPQNELNALQIQSQLGAKIIEWSDIVNTIDPDSFEMKALVVYAQMLSAPSTQKLEEISNKLKELGQSLSVASRFTVAAAFALQEDYKSALEVCETGSLQLLVLKIFILLKLGHIEIAEKDMIHLEDDETIGKLATAWFHLVKGNYKEAYLTFGDIQIFCCGGNEPENRSSLQLLNSKAVTNMGRHMWAEALEDLQIAYAQDPTDTVTLANLVCCYTNLSKPEEASKYFNLLERKQQDHFLVTKNNELEHAFQDFMR